ncbi:MAG: hypothetical protein NT007_15860 [Candidatus Kapabacteria bacterium]|nr:hypothetical protein [Candidatus Kapabacteria bacterium]
MKTKQIFFIVFILILTGIIYFITKRDNTIINPYDSIKNIEFIARLNNSKIDTLLLKINSDKTKFKREFLWKKTNSDSSDLVKYDSISIQYESEDNFERNISLPLPKFKIFTICKNYPSISLPLNFDEDNLSKMSLQTTINGFLFDNSISLIEDQENQNSNQQNKLVLLNYKSSNPIIHKNSKFYFDKNKGFIYIEFIEEFNSLIIKLLL